MLMSSVWMWHVAVFCICLYNDVIIVTVVKFLKPADIIPLVPSIPLWLAKLYQDKQSSPSSCIQELICPIRKETYFINKNMKYNKRFFY